MSGKRTVIAKIVLSHGHDYCFPKVLAWCREGGAVTEGLAEHFPERGSVYMRHSVAPTVTADNIVLLECEEGDESNGRSNKWAAKRYFPYLRQVLECPFDEIPLVVEWLEALDSLALERIPDTDEFFIRLGPLGKILGPVRRVREGRVASAWVGDVVRIEGVGIFVDKRALKADAGPRIILDAVSALRRVLRGAKIGCELQEFGRDDQKRLAQALANFLGPEVEWAHYLKERMGVFERLMDLWPELSDALLADARICQQLRGEWEAKNGELVGQLNHRREEIARLEGVLKTDEAKRKELEGSMAAAQSEIRKLEETTRQKRHEAGEAFESELKRIVGEPARLAILQRVLQPSAVAAPRAKGIELPDEKAETLHDALVINLRSLGVPVKEAQDVAVAVGVALQVGQPAAFRGLYSDLVAIACANAFGSLQTLLADIPGGVLDPVLWEFVPGTPGVPSFILLGVNRSDISLALGSLRIPLLRQIATLRPAEICLFATLETREQMTVQRHLPYGPEITCSGLLLHPCDGILVRGPGELSRDVAEPESLAEFEAELKDGGIDAASELLEAENALFLRRALGALQEVCEENAWRRLVRFWIAPRWLKEAQALKRARSLSLPELDEVVEDGDVDNT